MRGFFKKYLLFLNLVLITSGVLFFTSNIQAANGFKIDAGDTNWEINADGIYKEGVKISCDDIIESDPIGISSERSFIIQNDLGDKLILINENNIYTTQKNSFTTLTYPASLTKSFIIKDSDDDILLYVDAEGLHYKEGMCDIGPDCGNGIPETGEECDDGNTSNNDACLNNCEDADCGDSYIWSGNEECDDGNTSNNDACLNNCEDADCGDSYIWSGNEECDDGLANGVECICNVGWEESCDYCSSSCVLITKTDCTCLNGIIEPPEQCEWTFDPTDYFGCSKEKYCTSHCRCVYETNPEWPKKPSIGFE